MVSNKFFLWVHGSVADWPRSPGGYAKPRLTFVTVGDACIFPKETAFFQISTSLPASKTYNYEPIHVEFMSSALNHAGLTLGKLVTRPCTLWP